MLANVEGGRVGVFNLSLNLGSHFELFGLGGVVYYKISNQPYNCRVATDLALLVGWGKAYYINFLYALHSG